MTEKEEKAIYSFNKWIEISEKGHLDNYQIINEDIEDMKTILNMLEQKDKEISELKAKYDKDTHTLQNQLDVANADRVEKDKIIKQYENMILKHKKQLNKSGIYGYDYDLKILESEEEDE